jgi:hypothetical protein
MRHKPLDALKWLVSGLAFLGIPAFIIWKGEPYPGYSPLSDPTQRWWVLPFEIVVFVCVAPLAIGIAGSILNILLATIVNLFVPRRYVLRFFDYLERTFKGREDTAKEHSHERAMRDIWAVLFGLCLIAAGWIYSEVVGHGYFLEGWVAIAVCIWLASKCWHKFDAWQARYKSL